MAIAYFHTWTTYGTWLPGDDRGWYCRDYGTQDPNSEIHFASRLRMTEHAVILNPSQRIIVEAVVAEHCRFRNWILHAVHCRSNHVHVAVSAGEIPIKHPREQFKAWCTRRLKVTFPTRQHWWTERGWDNYIDTDEELSEVVRYIVEGQG
jgi:REP element-mobilizing transposase RayT